MREVWLILTALGYWGLLLIPAEEKGLRFGFLMAFALFLWLRNRRELRAASTTDFKVKADRKSRFRFGDFGVLICWVFLGCLALMQSPPDLQKMPEAGEYTIETVRDNYAIGSKDGEQVVFYNLENPVWKQKVQAEHFKEVHSLNNIGVFSFQRMLNGQSIGYSCEDGVLSERPSGLRVGLYDFFSGLPAGSMYRRLFYGMEKSESAAWLSRLGLPVLGLLGIVRKYLKRALEPKPLSGVMLSLMALWQCCFPFSASLMRVMVFEACRLVHTDWSVHWPLSVLGFLLVFPDQAGAFYFVLPALLGFVRHFQRKGWQRKAVSWIVCTFLQAGYFSSINGLLLFGFSFGRTLCGWIALIALGLLPVQSMACAFWNGIGSLALDLDRYSFEGAAGVWWMLLAGLCIFRLCFGWNGRRAGMAVGVLAAYVLSFSCSPFFSVYMLNIGQGDCTVIVEPFMKSVVMIDAAGAFNKDNAQDVIIPFLKSRRIQAIDALIVTHDDFDHSGAVSSLAENFPVRQVITEVYESIPVDYPFVSLLPEREADPEDENDQSIVVHFAYDGFSYLWTGDASSAIEAQLIDQYDLDADILKLGHHGSKTSSSKEFLRAVSPRLSLVSAGYQNRYGHPDAAVMERVLDTGSDVLSTNRQGMVSMKSLWGWMWIECADGTVSLIRAGQK